MWQMLTIVLCFLVLITILTAIAYKRGKEAERLRQIKEEIARRAQEQKYANEKMDFVRSLSKSDVNNKLHLIANSMKNKN